MSPKRISKPLDIYVRVSDVRGRAGESYISPKDQEERCRAAISSRGLAVGEVFIEEDVSGKSMERPKLAKARKRVEEGVSGGIVVAKIDRFGRTVARALDAIEEIDKAGGVVITAEGDFDTSTAVGELVLSMMLTLAHFELRRIRENWRSAQSRAVERGVHISRHVPPGYERDDSGRLKPHSKHGRTITKAFELAASGTPAAEIARYLTERGLPSGDNANAVWKSSRIKRLLSNRVYLGEARYGEIVNANGHAALTDETTFLRAQRKPAGPTASSTSSSLLTGLVRCAKCSHAMRPQKARGKTIATYRCATETASGRCPHPSSISMDKLDDYVFELHTDHTQGKRREPVAEHDDSETLAALEEAKSALAEIEAAKAELHPLAYAKALATAHENVDAAEAAISSRPSFDLDQAVEEATPMLLAELERVEAGGRILDGMTPDATTLLRPVIARDVQAVFVRPAASRSRTLPVSDRVHIVWRDDGEELELPQRGELFAPKRYVFPDESSAPSGKLARLAS